MRPSERHTKPRALHFLPPATEPPPAQTLLPTSKLVLSSGQSASSWSLRLKQPFEIRGVFCAGRRTNRAAQAVLSNTGYKFATTHRTRTHTDAQHGTHAHAHCPGEGNIKKGGLPDGRKLGVSAPKLTDHQPAATGMLLHLVCPVWLLATTHRAETTPPDQQPT